MEVKELTNALKAHNDKGGTYQVHLNTNNLEGKHNCMTGIEISDLHFSTCQAIKTIHDEIILMFGNENLKPIFKIEDGTNIYPMDSVSGMMITVSKIDGIEVVESSDDWFCYQSARVINLYMMPETDDSNGKRNIVSIGFME